MRRLVGLLCAAAFFFGLSGCGTGDPTLAELADEAAQEVGREDYRVVLAGAATDTLRGRALFGDILNPRTGEEQLVIKLETGVDFVGGLFVVRGLDQLPEERSYTLVDASQTPDTSLSSNFKVVYQEGLLRQLSSRQGTVNFSHVSDTLVAGSIEATLRGQIAPGGGELRPGEVHVTGRFRARRGTVGFVVGI